MAMTESPPASPRCSWQWTQSARNASCNRCGQDDLPFLGFPIGKFAPNEFRLYDMHGSVSEWVEDCYHDRYDGAPTDGSEWTAVNCRYRVVRGGSQKDSPERLRSASRDGAPATLEDDSLGFRVARTLTR